MKELIEKRVENYKTHRQQAIDKQNSYKWSEEELDKGSELYGLYQEKEALFANRITELEWVLSILDK